MSKKQNPIDFTNQDNCKNAKYKLWIVWLPQYRNKWGGNDKMTFYGSNKRKNNGFDWLFEKAKSLRTEFKVAIIYDNQTGLMKHKIPGCDLAHLNKSQSNLDNQL